MYLKLITIHQEEDSLKSPIVFVHGFPDSARLFEAYHSVSERQAAWLKGRSIYAIEFPNRQQSNPQIPNLLQLIRQVMKKEFATLITQLIQASPSQKIIPIVHDLGATYTWRYIRENGDSGIEKMVALSVGSSFRFDIWEHGFFAIAWLYSLLYILPYYIPIQANRALLAKLLAAKAGYQSDSIAKVYRDVFHYWYAPLWLLCFPAFFIPLPIFLNFRFPVLYMRSPLDRIASTKAFENKIANDEKSRLIILEDANHWFPEQQAECVLSEIRTFLL